MGWEKSFVSNSPPRGREEDFYEVLEAFARRRQAGEFVKALRFASADEASVQFSDGGMHGGGVEVFKKQSGRWISIEKFHFM